MRIAIPIDSIFRPTANLFTATFNNPTIGQYDFAIAANTEQLVMPIDDINLFYISIANYSANVPESSYLENLDTSDIPKIRFLTGQNKKPLYGGTYPLAKYLVTNEVGTFFRSKQAKDSLIATFTGKLNQNANLAGVVTITAVVALNIWEISDREFLNKFDKISKSFPQQQFDVEVPAEFERRV